jgi:hypothetical protein
MQVYTGSEAICPYCEAPVLKDRTEEMGGQILHLRCYNQLQEEMDDHQPPAGFQTWADYDYFCSRVVIASS